MKHRLPLITERAVREAEATRRLAADNFEAKLRGQLEGVVTCQKGCHSCCYYPVVLSVLEGVTLYRWLSDQGLWRKPLQDKFKEAHQHVWGLSPSVWMLSMTPCPLLSAEGLCEAHEARPFVCRTTTSTGDPFYCHPHRFAEGLAGLVSRRGAEVVVQEAENRLLKSSRLTLLRLPLATAVLMGERICKDGIEPEEVSAQLFVEWSRTC